MKFTEIVHHAKNCPNVEVRYRRESWEDGCYLVFSSMFSLKLKTLLDGEFIFCIPDEVPTVYVFSTFDMFADDWEIVYDEEV